MDIQQENAAELGHLINQISTVEEDRHALSEFLKKNDKESASAYNKKLKIFIDKLITIPNHEEFVKALRPIPMSTHSKNGEWTRRCPIDQTPKNHLIHAEYLRVPHSHSIDQHRGKPMPLLFYRAVNIMGIVDNLIEGFEKIYYIIKPFGYVFPDILETDDMTFRLLELYNPLYVCFSKKNGYPMPIMIDDTPMQPIGNKEYTSLYKKYIRQMNPDIGV